MGVIPGSPIVQGAMQGAQTKNAILNNRAMQDKLKTLPQALQAQLMAQQQQAQQAQYKTQFMPQQLQAMLALQQAQTPLVQSQTSANQMRTSLMPQQFNIAQQNALSKAQAIQQSKSRFNDKTTLVRSLNNPAVKDLYSKNKQFANAADRVLMGTASIADRTITQQVLSNAGMGQQQQQQQGGMNQIPSGLTQAFANQIQQGQQGQQRPQGQPQQQGGFSPQQLMSAQQQQQQLVNKQLGLTPEQVKSSQDIAGSDAIKRTTNPQVQRARYAGDSLDTMIKDVDSKIDDISSFAGMKGKFKLFSNNSAIPFGKESEAYDNYKIFTQQTIPAMGAKVRTLSMSPATQQEVEQYMSIISDPDMLHSNPKLVKKSWNSLKGLINGMKSTEGKSLAQISGGAQPSGAQQPVSLPEFSSKEEALQWYRSATPEQKALAQGAQ